MQQQSTMRSGNPALNKNTFLDAASGNLSTHGGDVMTLNGTVNKTGLLLVLVLVGAIFSWSRFTGEGSLPAMMPLVLIGALGGFAVAMVTAFKKTWAPYTAPVYAVLEGLFIGALSAIFELRYPGIVIQAVGLTFGTMAVLLLAYRSGLIKVTEKFKLGVVAATGGVMLLYLVNFGMGFFGHQMGFINGASTLGIGFSVLVVIIAAMNLVLDFDMIETGVNERAPKYMEWYGAFALVVTLSLAVPRDAAFAVEAAVAQLTPLQNKKSRRRTHASAAFSCWLVFQQGLGALGHVVRREPERLEQLVGGGGGTEVVDAQHVTAVTYITFPALRRTHFHRQSGSDAGWQHFVLIVLRLGVEQIPAGHGHATHGDAISAQLFRGVEDQAHFRTGGDQDQVGLTLFDIAQHIRALAQAFRAGVALTIQRRQFLPRQRQQHRVVYRFHHHFPRHGGFVGVRGSDHAAVGYGAQAGQLLDRLMGRTVLAQRDAVVGENVHQVQLHQRGETDCRTHVVGEDQEGGAVRQEAAVRRQPVDDGAHGVFAHAEVQIAPGLAPPGAVRPLSILCRPWRSD